jgi:hypothetical protein
MLILKSRQKPTDKDDVFIWTGLCGQTGATAARQPKSSKECVLFITLYCRKELCERRALHSNLDVRSRSRARRA